MSDVFDPNESIASVRKEDGEWVIFCRRCGTYLKPPAEVGGRDWLTQTSATTGALDHAQRKHWTPGVVQP